jgi:hypothetical protein
MSSNRAAATQPFLGGYNSLGGQIMMSEILSIQEIESRYPDEWILLEDPETGANQKVSGGIVRCHSADRDEVYQKAIELSPKRIAFLYTGTVPEEGMEFAL